MRVEGADWLQPDMHVRFAGCGEGKYSELNTNVVFLGVERCSAFALLAAQRCEASMGDILQLPFRSATVDVLLCVSVIHHLSTEDRRLQAAMELFRVLKPGGCMLVHAWSLEQETDTRRAFNSQDVMVCVSVCV